LTPRLHPRQEQVDALERAVLGRAVAEADAEVSAGRHERHRKVAVDVRVHPGERELERCDPAIGPPREQRHPRPRSARRITLICLERGKEQACEGDVEALEEGRVRDVVRGHVRADALGHLPVEVREARDAVAARTGHLERPQPLDHLRDARRLRRAHA
jgi:hypothetical protein